MSIRVDSVPSSYDVHNYAQKPERKRTAAPYIAVGIGVIGLAT